MSFHAATRGYYDCNSIIAFSVFRLKLLIASQVLKTALTKFEVDLVKAGGGTTHTKSQKNEHETQNGQLPLGLRLRHK